MDRLYKAGLDAGHLMRKPITLDPGSTVLAARDLLLRYNIGRILVSKDDKAIGMLTDFQISER